MKHYIIPVFIPHYGCIHQCVFCNQQKITGMTTPVNPEQVELIIKENLSRLTTHRRVEVAFYGGSFTGLPLTMQNDLLQPAQAAMKAGLIKTIRVSTRPDCINEEIVANLVNHDVSIIELGAQSLDNQVLKVAGRGHNNSDVSAAAKIIKNAGIQCGLQLMIGLPAEDWLSLIETTNRAVAINPHFVRIYPTVVIANTELARMWKNGAYCPLTLDEAIERSAYMKLMFEYNNIPVIRTGLQATDELSNSDAVLAGPYHPAFGETVDSYLFCVMVRNLIRSLPRPLGRLVLHFHPKDHSKIRGQRNSNISRYMQEGLTDIKLVADGDRIGQITAEHKQLRYVINKKMLICI